jgi:lysophospholipase L1-like esterase
MIGDCDTEMKILCIGDSNTYGYDPRSYIGSRYPAEVRWTDRLGDHEVINRGVNGMKIPREYSSSIRMIRGNDPDLVTVMLGTNDLLSGSGAEEIAAQMERYLDAIGSAAKKILLISPPLLQPGEWTMDDEALEGSQNIGVLYKKTASVRGCRFADSAEWDIDISFDGVHFLPEGHARFAEKLNEIINIISF